MDRLTLRGDIIGCHRCSLHGMCNSPVPWDGSPSNSIVVVGEAPGAKEDQELKPFIGPAGQLLRSIIRSLGVDDTKLNYLNVVSCFPHRTPRVHEVDACRENLWNQLQYLRPTWCLLVGTVAISSWWKDIGVERLRGQFFQVYWQNDVQHKGNGDGWSWGFSTYHPAAILRNSSLAGEFKNDLSRFFEVASQRQTPESTYRSECVRCGRECEIVHWAIPFCDKCAPGKRDELLVRQRNEQRELL